MIYHLANSLKKRNLVILNVTDDKRILYKNDYSYSIRSPNCKGSCITHFHDDRNNDCNPEICMKNLTSELVIKKFVRDIYRTSKMLTQKDKSTLGKEMVFKKLGKSITALHDLNAGSELKLSNISSKIFSNTYIHVRESMFILGKKLKVDVKKDEPIKLENLID